MLSYNISLKVVQTFVIDLKGLIYPNILICSKIAYFCIKILVIMSGKKSKEKKFINTPQYPGGNKMLRKFIDTSLKYPEEALKHKVEGVVHVNYTVTDTGKVEDIKVTHGIGYGCDEEAIRVISMLKYESAFNRGVRVRSSLRTRINFRLPVNQPVELKYSISSETKTKIPADKSTGNVVYGYTLTFNKPE